MVPVTSAQLCYCSEEAVTGNTQRTNQALFQQNYFLKPGLRDGKVDLVLRIQTLHSWGMLTCLVSWVVCYYPEVAGEGPVAERELMKLASNSLPHSAELRGSPHSGHRSWARARPYLLLCRLRWQFYNLPDLYLQKCLPQDWCWGNEPMAAMLASALTPWSNGRVHHSSLFRPVDAPSLRSTGDTCELVRHGFSH